MKPVRRLRTRMCCALCPRMGLVKRSKGRDCQAQWRAGAAACYRHPLPAPAQALRQRKMWVR